MTGCRRASNIAGAVGLGAALDDVDSIGMEAIARYEHELLVYATQRLPTVPGLKLVGTAADKASVLSFVLDGCRTQDVGAALDREGIAVRAGHHCAQPILRRFGLESTVRPSFAFYNTTDDVPPRPFSADRCARMRRRSMPCSTPSPRALLSASTSASCRTSRWD